jgi:RNA polymerase sigma-70 factor (ECF subfamily)
LTARSDEDLIAAFYESQDRAFDALAERWRPNLERFFSRLRFSAADVEILVQETWVRIWVTRQRPTTRFDPLRGSFCSWVYRIGYRVALEKWREEQRRGRVVELDETRHAHDRAAPDPAFVILEGIRRCMEGLTEQERVFISLWEEAFGTLNQTDIAGTMDLSSARVSGIKAGALKKLRECLERHGFQ